jgi:hypothetical protein
MLLTISQYNYNKISIVKTLSCHHHEILVIIQFKTHESPTLIPGQLISLNSYQYTHCHLFLNVVCRNGSTCPMDVNEVKKEIK